MKHLVFALIFGALAIAAEPANDFASRTTLPSSVSSGIDSQSARRSYAWSERVYLAANVADIATSWRRRELNPLLGRGEFAWRGVAIKSGIVGAQLLASRWMMRRHPALRAGFTVANYAGAAWLSGMAVRNSRVR